MPGSLTHSCAYLFFIEVATKLLCLGGIRHLPGASAYLSIKVKGREMSLQEGAQGWFCQKQWGWNVEPRDDKRPTTGAKNLVCWEPDQGVALLPSGWFSADPKFLTQSEQHWNPGWQSQLWVLRVHGLRLAVSFGHAAEVISESSWFRILILCHG